MNRYRQFQEYRTRMNARILGDEAARAAAGGGRADGTVAPGATLVTKRFFSLDHQTYQDGALAGRTKELLGLTASAVLRCDDCIGYHVDQCVRAGYTDEEIWEALDVALVVGGSIVIPHLRRAIEFLDLARAGATRPS